MSAQNASSISVGARAMIKSIVVYANTRFGHKNSNKDWHGLDEPPNWWRSFEDCQWSIFPPHLPGMCYIVWYDLECPECPVTTSFSFHIPRTITTESTVTCVITDSLVLLLLLWWTTALSHLVHSWGDDALVIKERLQAQLSGKDSFCLLFQTHLSVFFEQALLHFLWTIALFT